MNGKIISAVLVVTLLILACGGQAPRGTEVPSPTMDPNKQAASFAILADYNVQAAFEGSGVLNYCADNTTVTIEGNPVRVSTSVAYTSSTGLSVTNSEKDKRYQAYWTTSVVFLPNMPNLPDYTAKSYIIVATAEDFGWDANNFHIEDVLKDQAAGRVRLGMVNPSVADPSRSFLIAAMTAMANQSMLTAEGLNGLDLNTLKSYFGTTKGATDSVQTLIDQIVADQQQQTGKFNTYVLDEASLIRINQILVEKHLKPLKAYYMLDATFGEKFPLALTGDAIYRDAFIAYTRCLHSEQATRMLLAKGYRTNQIGFSVENPDLSIFNPAWGIHADMSDLPLKDYPRADVAQLAVDTYMTSLSPQKREAICFDESGSTHDNGAREQMHGWVDGGGVHKGAYDYLLDQNQARVHGMALGLNDAAAVSIFSDTVQYMGTAYGANKTTFTPILTKLKEFSNQGGTPMYDCVTWSINLMTHRDKAFEEQAKQYHWEFPPYEPDKYIYIVYLMTDGENSAGMDANGFTGYWNSLSEADKIPVYAVGFGKDVKVDKGSPLYDLADLTGGKVIGTTGDLLEALKSMFANY